MANMRVAAAAPASAAAFRGEPGVALRRRVVTAELVFDRRCPRLERRHGVLRLPNPTFRLRPRRSVFPFLS